MHPDNVLTSRSDVFVDVNKITCVFGLVEIESFNEDLFTFESVITISCEGSLFPLPIFSHRYQLKRPGYFKRIKNSDKLNDRLNIWKKDEIAKVKRKNTDLVLKTLQILDRIKKTTEYYHTPYDLSGELCSIDKMEK